MEIYRRREMLVGGLAVIIWNSEETLRRKLTRVLEGEMNVMRSKWELT